MCTEATCFFRFPTSGCIYINCACAAYKLSAKSHKPGLMHYVSNDASAMATEGLAQISISYLEMYRDPC